MNKEEIINLVNKMISEKTERSQFSPSNTTFHTHNGIDSPQISENDVVSGSKYTFSFSETPPSASGGDIVIVDSVLNPSSVYFYGIASAVGSFRKATITGYAELGDCYRKSTIGSTGLPTSIVQICNTTYIDAAEVLGAVTNAQMYSAFSTQRDTYLASVVDPGTPSTYFVKFNITSFDSTSVTFNAQVDVNWSFSGNIIIT